MPKQSLSHDVNVLNQKSSNSNDLPVAKRHTMVTNQLEDNTKNNSRLTKSNIHQQYQQQYQQEKQQQIDSTNSKIKKTSLTALNLIDKEDSFKNNKNSIINYGETIQSTKKMFANSSNLNSLNYKTDTNGSTSKPLTSKSNHFELNSNNSSTNKDNKSNKIYNVISMQPSPSKETKNRSGFDELDLLISKAKNLQTFQTSLLKQKNVSSKSRKITSNSKSAVSDSRISLNQADISSNIARAKETIKKMSSSSNLEANNMNTSNNNELPVLVALPMPNFSTPSYSSLGMGMPSFNTSNPSISMPQPQHQNQHQQMQQHQQQQQQQQYEQQQQMSQNQQAFQLPSNIPLVIPLGPPLETSSLYNLNQQFFQSAPLPIQKTVAKQKIKELKLKKQSKQSKSMEASINKINQEKPTDFSLEKKLSKPTESILTTSSNDNTKDTTNDSVLSITEPVKEKELSYKQPSRLPPPPAVVIPKTINSESIISKKSDEESLVSNKKSSVHNEINARLKQSSLHITEPSTSPVPKDSILLITDSNYSVPCHYKSLMAEAAKITLDKPLRQPEPPAKPQETPLKAKDNSTTCTTMITNIKSAPVNEPRQVELLNNTKPVDNTLKTKTIITNNSVKKLNDLTELLNAKYGIYKGTNLVTSQAPVAQLQSKSQPQVQPQAIAKPVIETKISPVVSSDSQQPPITELRKLPQQQQQQQQTTTPTKSGPSEYKTSLHIGKQFNSNEITVHLVDDTLEDKKTNVKKLIVHCNRIEPISSRSITLNPGQFNAPTTIDLNLNDGKNYLRKELKREIVLPNDCDIDSLESYLENGYLHFKCYLIKPAVNELKHAQIVSLPRLEFKNDQSTIIKRSLLNLERESNELSKKKFNNSSRSDFINKSILKLNSDEISDPKQNSDNLNESATTSETTSQFIQLEPKPHKPNANRGRHQSLPSGSSTKSVRFNMNNRIQLEDQNGKNDNKKNDSTGAKISHHNSSSSNGQAHRHRHRSNSTKSKPDSAHRRTSSNTSNNLTNRLSNDLINDGFNCITKDGLENIFLTYFFKLPSCSPSDRTQVRIEKNSILKLKIIQEKNFAKKNKSRKHNHRQHHRHHGSSSSSLSSSIISSALSSSSDSSMSSSLSSDSDESTVNNEKITKIKQENETTKIVLREFSRRCRLPYKVFKFDETGVTVSFINNDWVRVEIPIMEILDNNLMATMTSESNFSIFNKRVRTNTKLDHKSSQQLENSKNSNEFKEEKMNSNLKLKMGGSGVYKTSNHNLITSSSKYL